MAEDAAGLSHEGSVDFEVIRHIAVHVDIFLGDEAELYGTVFGGIDEVAVEPDVGNFAVDGEFGGNNSQRASDCAFDPKIVFDKDERIVAGLIGVEEGFVVNSGVELVAAGGAFAAFDGTGGIDFIDIEGAIRIKDKVIAPLGGRGKIDANGLGFGFEIVVVGGKGVEVNLRYGKHPKALVMAVTPDSRLGFGRGATAIFIGAGIGFESRAHDGVVDGVAADTTISMNRTIDNVESGSEPDVVIVEKSIGSSGSFAVLDSDGPGKIREG